MPFGREVWVVYHDKEKAPLGTTRQQIKTECGRRGWQFYERATSTLWDYSKEHTRNILPSTDATHIYRRLHRAKVAILAFTNAHVCLIPVPDYAPVHGDIITLYKFCLYKCFYESASSSKKWSVQDAQEFSERFESSCSTVKSEGERDPRCLPLHVFKARGGMNLFDVADRRTFDAEYGAAPSRTDAEGRIWDLDPQRFHGREVLHVAGAELRAGYHWDVEPGRGFCFVTTTSEVWKVERYVNVGPDAHIRGEPPHARRVYPRQK